MIAKRLHTLVAALLVCATAAAQHPAAYFMEGSTLRSRLNPALAPQRGYFDIPALGGVDAAVNTDVALDRLLFTRGGRLVTLLDREVSAADALAGLSADNRVGSDVRLSLLSFGSYARNGKSFWSVDINVRASGEVNLPRSLVEFAKRGDDGAIRNLSAAAESWVDAGFAYSFPLLDERLYLGFRAKAVVGGARARLDFDRLDVVLHEERWSVDAQGTLDAHIPGAAVEYRTDEAGDRYFEPSDISVDGFRPAGYGMALDLGVACDILPDLKASLAVTDLGFIVWNARSAVQGTAAARLEYTGVEIAGGQGASSPDFDLDDLMRFAARGSRIPAVAPPRVAGAALREPLPRHDHAPRPHGVGQLHPRRMVHARLRLHAGQHGRLAGAGAQPLPGVDQPLRGHRPAHGASVASVLPRAAAHGPRHAGARHPHGAFGAAPRGGLAALRPASCGRPIAVAPPQPKRPRNPRAPEVSLPGSFFAGGRCCVRTRLRRSVGAPCSVRAAIARTGRGPTPPAAGGAPKREPRGENIGIPEFFVTFVRIF